MQGFVIRRVDTLRAGFGEPERCVVAGRPADPLRAAQTQKDEPLVSSARTINLAEENRYLIREIVLKDPKVKKDSGPPAAIGDQAPPGVATEPFPAELSEKVPALRSHRFFVADGAVVVVDPKTNKVADIVKQTN